MIAQKLKRTPKRFARRAALVSRGLALRFTPKIVQCNICGWEDTKFATDHWHQHIRCRRCQSGFRHRLLWSLLTSDTPISIKTTIQRKRVLHFAPEKHLRNLIAAQAGQYAASDLFNDTDFYGPLDYNLDMSDMSEVSNESFDCFIACDVLEHVREHEQALSETHRILTPGGCAILTVPQADGLQQTQEDLSPLSPQERVQKFGQRDHWRIYGEDFSKIIERAGFQSVHVLDHQNLSQEVVNKHVLRPPVSNPHPLATNHRRFYAAFK